MAAKKPAGGIASLDPAEFSRRLTEWYRAVARKLPWRATTDPYRIWVSEIMLQQTRVAAVVEHYNEFLRRFPSLLSLSLAEEADVLAAWSGLGYYRRARMLHKAARFIVLERDGRLPATAEELRTLPGIGDYTAAAIASIAFGEPVAVVDGNVERVVLRLVGRADEATAAARAFVRKQAQALMPGAELHPTSDGNSPNSKKPLRVLAGRALSSCGAKQWEASERIALAASAHPEDRAGGITHAPKTLNTEAGDHNQAMMELGATVCLPRVPLCNECPVFAMCRTRGEHLTQPRAPQRSVPAAYLLDLRKRGTATEVLLELRSSGANLMPAMFELPPLPIDLVEGREPVLRVRHSITNTNYYVQVYAPQRFDPGPKTKREKALMHPLRKAVHGGKQQENDRELHWVRASNLPGIPMTGLTRKVLQRLRVMESARMALLE
jgi:A/G-specific adenine glycosylase